MIATQKNEKGFTLIEMLISMAIGVVLLGTAIYTYTKQDSLVRDENSNVQLRDFARLAMDALVPDIRMAGYGFPPGDSGKGRPAQGIDVADATTLTYFANTDNVLTYANGDRLSADNWIDAIDPLAAGFVAGDNVVFFNANDPNEWNRYPAAGVSNAMLVWDPLGPSPNGFDIQPVTNGVPTVINKYHIININYNAGTQIITVTDDNGTAAVGDDTTITVADNVSDLTFSYFDPDGTELTALPLSAADLGEVRRIQISVTVVNPDQTDMTVTLSTNVHLRNMGT